MSRFDESNEKLAKIYLESININKNQIDKEKKIILDILQKDPYKNSKNRLDDMEGWYSKEEIEKFAFPNNDVDFLSQEAFDDLVRSGVIETDPFYKKIYKQYNVSNKREDFLRYNVGTNRIDIPMYRIIGPE